jgi:release factor glutamine methyltransferase
VPPAWTIRTTLAAAADILAKRGIEEARLDAEHLLAHALGVRRIDLYADFDRPLDEAERARYRSLILERANGRPPLAYVTGKREFFGIELLVTRDVLVPRPETELLVEAALDELARRARTGAGPALVADIGTGSGAIAVAVARLAKGPAPSVLALERSPAAAALARRNVERTCVADRVEVVEGDLVAPLLARGLEGRVDLFLSNPPYVGLRERGSLAPEVLAEPEEALFAGPDGLDVLRALVAAAPALLAPGGLLLVEHGAEQGPPVVALARAAGLAEVTTRRDLAGRDRLLIARRPAA